MSPLRWDVLLVGFVLALPVLALGLRGDLSTEEMMTRVLWCLGAGWAVVALFRLATTPPPSETKTKRDRLTADEPAESADSSPAV
jgi:hypothetical protein